MAAGIPVVSTTIGAEGLKYSNQKDIVIADGPVDFAAACVRLLSDETARQGIAQQALSLAQTELSWNAVSYKFEAILERNRISSTR
jgi:glycosyltransferase involved in cell wall biosynthesis